MSAVQVEQDPQAVEPEYVKKLGRVIARNADLQLELENLVALWEAERSQLKTRIVQLEHSLVELIERSSNPLRTSQISEDKIRLVEEAKREWTAQWTAERQRLEAEVNRLRKLQMRT